jgi:hypothetical protein
MYRREDTWSSIKFVRPICRRARSTHAARADASAGAGIITTWSVRGAECFRASRQPSQRSFACLDFGSRLLSSPLVAMRTIVWTINFSSRAICWSCRFIDFCVRTARKTTSSSTVCFLATVTAMPSPVLGTRNGRSHGLLQNDVVRVLPLDLSVILHDHLIKRSRSSRSELISSNFSSFRKGVWP